MANDDIQDSMYEPKCERTGATFGGLLLDSSLIVTTNNTQLYEVKIVNCGDYIQVYYLENNKIKKNKALEKVTHKKNNINSIALVDTDNLITQSNSIIDDESFERLRQHTDKIQKKYLSATKQKNIQAKNIMRSKLQCQRLAKCNANEWKTFITLTIAENLTDINKANKKLRYFIDKIQRIYKDFKYICIPEFQKRGAVHYHLLTNIDINDKRFIYKQPGKEKFKHIKYWNEGFNSVDSLEKDIKKIVGYISKYMTKDIDDRLYNHRRYFYSRNLRKPSTSYLNLSDPKHLEYYMKIISDKSLIYSNSYLNPYNYDVIQFNEFM